jgi:hypothetical protein
VARAGSPASAEEAAGEPASVTTPEPELEPPPEDELVEVDPLEVEPPPALEPELEPELEEPEALSIGEPPSEDVDSDGAVTLGDPHAATTNAASNAPRSLAILGMCALIRRLRATLTRGRR